MTETQIRISNLPEAFAIDNDDLIYAVINGESRKLTKETFLEDVNIYITPHLSNKVYVSSVVDAGGNGSYQSPFKYIEDALDYAWGRQDPVSTTVLPGTYLTNGDLEIPDFCSVISTNGQYSTTIVMNTGFEERNCFLVGSGCYIQGFSFNNQRIDDLTEPTVGFSVAFRPGSYITRSPYIRDISQISNYIRQNISAPLDPANANPLVGNGGGVLLADRAVLDQNSIFPYMLAFGATPRSPNGIGYCAKNGAGINGISSISIFQRTAFYALSGGQITLNNSGTQFGDISMRASGSTEVVDPQITDAPILKSVVSANAIDNAAPTIINNMWNYLVGQGYTVNEVKTRRDAANWLKSISYDFRAGQQTGTRNFIAGLFNYNGDQVFSVFNPPAPNLNLKGSVTNPNLLSEIGNAVDDAFIIQDSADNAYVGQVFVWNGVNWVSIGTNNTNLLDSFIDSFIYMRGQIVPLLANAQEITMLNGLVTDVTIGTLANPSRITFGSLIESLGHQFNLAGAGVNKNALPLNFRRVGTQVPASGSVLQENNGRVRWSGADELNNQYFAGGLRVNGRTGKLEGRPFTSSVRRLARRAANSRVSL